MFRTKIASSEIASSKHSTPLSKSKATKTVNKALNLDILKNSFKCIENEKIEIDEDKTNLAYLHTVGSGNEFPVNLFKHPLSDQSQHPNSDK